MLEFKSSIERETFITLQNKVGVYQSYIDDVLLPAVKRGCWDELENITIIRTPDGRIINFHDDIWDLSSLPIKDPGKIYFTISENFGDNKKGIGRKLDRNTCNQIKCFAICLIFCGTQMRGFPVIRQYINRIKHVANIMESKDIYSFSLVDLDCLTDWAQEYEIFSNYVCLSSLSIMSEQFQNLPYHLNLGHVHRLTSKILNVLPAEFNQHLVIPVRIYSNLIKQFSEEIQLVLSNIDDLRESLDVVFDIENKMFLMISDKIRFGTSSIDSCLSKLSAKNIKDIFNSAGVSLIDNGSDDRWLSLFNDSNPAFKNRSKLHKRLLNKRTLKVGDIKFSNVSKFLSYIRTLDSKCKILCLILSGMRVDELYRISPVYGMQTFHVQKQEICLFTTRQSKITVDQQTKDDVFVTTSTGHKAFKILDAIHSRYRSYFSTEQYRMFSTLDTFRNIRPAKKHTMVAGLIEFLASENTDLEMTLTSEDIKYLNISDPLQTKYKQGDKFRITNHMFRRSLAYYLIGYELLSFPQLKDQLSHLSPAMTRWYANNASSFQKFYKEICKERTRQQSNILARIYNRIANKERIAGGKGKALSFIAGEGNNYFESEGNRKKLSPNYWEKLIENNKTHIHAIAPGMYCTNNNCSMRINIELGECLDCENSIIEEVVFAEETRLKAMKDLLYLEENGELNHSGYSYYAMKIKSAERIMSDLNFVYEPFSFPVKFSSSNIELKSVFG